MSGGGVLELVAACRAGVGACGRGVGRGGRGRWGGRPSLTFGEAVFEFLLRLAEITGQLRQLRTTEDDEHNGEDDEPLGPGWNVVTLTTGWVGLRRGLQPRRDIPFGADSAADAGRDRRPGRRAQAPKTLRAAWAR